MIEGTVNARHEAVVNLRVQGPNGQILEFDAAVDTGYEGFLTLPAAAVVELALPFSHTSQAILADDSPVQFPVHHVAVFWDGEPRNIPADITGSTPLIGMLLLDGYRLIIDVEVGGGVVIQAKP